MEKVVENRKNFLARLSGNSCRAEAMLVEFAYDLAKEAHRPTKRSTGERYFEHPRAVSIILMDELGIYDTALLIASLLHDTGEDTALLGNGIGKYKDFLTTALFRLVLLFGKNTAEVVIALTKPWVDNEMFFSKEQAYEYYISQLAENDRALICKAADRLHNLRTLPKHDRAKIEKQITETEEVYLPLFTAIEGRYKPFMQILIEKITHELQTLKASLS